jgi:hypothetical protein
MVLSHENGFVKRSFPTSTEDLATKYGWNHTNEEGYTINEAPSGLLRPIKIICLGAGASGINWAKLVQDQMENIELQIYDKNSDVGGTWLENRYPYVCSGMSSTKPPSTNYRENEEDAPATFLP